MRCPYCRHPDSRVVDSREQEEGQVIRRRRSCPECGRRFTTIEQASLIVIKRSGVTEPFSRQKVIVGVRRACQGRPVDEDALALLAQTVEESIRATGAAEVASDEVGLAILGPLRELDEVAYLRFASVYQAFTSVDDFDKAIAELRNRRTDIPLVDPRRLHSAVAAVNLGKCSPQSQSPVRPTSPRETPHNDRHRQHQAQGQLERQLSQMGRHRRSASRYPSNGLVVERVYTTAGVHPYDEVTWERRDVVMTNWRDGSINFEQRGVEFPEFWSVNAANIVTTKYFRGAVGTDVREWSLRQLIDRVVNKLPRGRRGHGYFAHRPTTPRSSTHELTWMLLHQVFSFNSPVWFNVGTTVAAAGQRLLHPGRRRHDGLDPELVPRRGPDLQGRLRRGPEPLPHPLVQGAAVLRRHRLGPGQLHARRRRLGRHDQVRRRHPARGEDGRPRHRPPRHRRVRRDQGARGGQDPRAAQRRLRHGPRRRRHRRRSSTRTPTTRCGSPTSSCARSRRAASSGCGPASTGEVIETVDARELFTQGGQGGLGVRRPGHPVRRHDQRLAHQPRDRADHRVQPVLGVHEPGQHLLQPGVAEPDEVPRRRQRLRRGPSSSRRSS